MHLMGRLCAHQTSAVSWLAGCGGRSSGGGGIG